MSADDGGGAVYGCLDVENVGGTTFTQDSAHKVLFHHIQTTTGNVDPGAYFATITGSAWTPSGGSWAAGFYPISGYNFTTISSNGPSSGRQHAGMWVSGGGPVEYYNNSMQCLHYSSACEQLEVYGIATNGTYAHNNHGFCANLDNTANDGCRAILFDDSQNDHAQYNDLWPNSIDGSTCQPSNGSTNRGIRLRDAFNAEVDRNYVHCFTDVAIHTGDPDIHSGIGAGLNQNIHDNIIELAGGSGVLNYEQQGITLNNNTFLCASAGCSGSSLVNLQNFMLNFGGGSVTVNAVAKTITQASGNWQTNNSGSASPTIDVGSQVSLLGFSNAGNNNTFTITAVTATSITVADPNNLLVSETTSSGHWGGVATVTLTGVAPGNIGSGLTPKVSLVQNIPSVTLDYCGTVSLTQTSSGGTIANTCNGSTRP